VSENEARNKTQIGGLEILGHPIIIDVNDKKEGLACPDCGCDVTFTIVIKVDIEGTAAMLLKARKEKGKGDLGGEVLKFINEISEGRFGQSLRGIFPGCAACGWKGPLALAIEKDGKVELLGSDADDTVSTQDCNADCEHCDRARPGHIGEAEAGMKERGEDGTPKGMISVPLPSATPISVPPLFKKWN
jgi:hypothetical protein